MAAEEWLLIEWPDEWPDHEETPTKYWLSTLPDTTSLDELVDVTKRRWRSERDDQELKQEIGLGHYEGRGWRGFHHHATLCIAAYGFLIAESNRILPSAPVAGPRRPAFALPPDDRPRGSPRAPGAPRPELDRHHPAPTDDRPGNTSDPMSMLPPEPAPSER